MLNMFRMLINPTSGACDLFVELFHGLYWFGTMCVGVTLWFGWDTTPTQPHRNSNTHRTKNDTTNVVIQKKKSQAPDDGYINVRNMWSTWEVK